LMSSLRSIDPPTFSCRVRFSCVDRIGLKPSFFACQAQFMIEREQEALFLRGNGSFRPSGYRRSLLRGLMKTYKGW
jgi:hypothetical protein